MDMEDETEFKTVEELNDALEKAVTKTDVCVLKRLRFILKIMRAIPGQTNGRNRQVHAYIMEVLDAISDWSGNENAQIEELLEKDIFQQISRLVSSFSSQEFDEFQQYFAKYLIQKWGATSNFEVLNFLCNIYGFIASIAPMEIIDEFVEVFSSEAMPPHISLVILPSIVHNVPDSILVEFYENWSSLDLIVPPKTGMLEEHIDQVTYFWTSLSVSVNEIESFSQLCQVLCSCVTSSSCVVKLPLENIEQILQSLTEWCETGHNVDVFLMVSSTFLYLACRSLPEEDSPYSSLERLKNQVVRLVVSSLSKSKNRDCRCFTLKVIKEIVKSSDQYCIEEIISNFESDYEVNLGSVSINDKEFEKLRQSLELYFKRALDATNKNESNGIKEKIQILKTTFPPDISDSP